MFPRWPAIATVPSPLKPAHAGLMGFPLGKFPVSPAAVVTTGQNDDELNQSVVVPIPPRMWNGAICSGDCWLPLPTTFSELPLAVKFNGRPLLREITPLRPQLPASQPMGPDCSQCLPGPKGKL